MNLMDFVRDAMFEAVVRQLFGHNNVPQEKVRRGVILILLRAAGACFWEPIVLESALSSILVCFCELSTRHVLIA